MSDLLQRIYDKTQAMEADTVAATSTGLLAGETIKGWVKDLRSIIGLPRLAELGVEFVPSEEWTEEDRVGMVIRMLHRMEVRCDQPLRVMATEGARWIVHLQQLLTLESCFLERHRKVFLNGSPAL